MRTTQELIAELDAETAKHWTVLLVVSYESTTIFIGSTDDSRLQLLNDAIAMGGIPLGLICADKNGGSLTIKSRVYPEHLGEARRRCEQVLQRLTTSVGQSLMAGAGD